MNRRKDRRIRPAFVILLAFFVVVLIGFLVLPKLFAAKNPVGENDVPAGTTAPTTNTTEAATTTTPAPTTPAPTSTEEKTEPPVVTIEDQKKAIDLSVKPNEVGEVMIVMYHNLAEKNTQYARTPTDFRKDLQRLYDMGFVSVSMSDYINSNFDIPAGKTPVVFTFDDGHQTNFNYIDGKIDPNCVIGIMNDFYEKNPDFGRNAIFYLNGGKPFGGGENYKEKIKYLIENGYEIGNHTWGHEDLSVLSAADIQQVIGRNNNYYMELTGGIPLQSIALPYGQFAKPEYMKNVMKGSYDGTDYHNKIALMVGWRPTWPLYTKGIDKTAIYRVQSGDGEVQLTWWLDNYEAAPENRYISDGNPNIISVPQSAKDSLGDDLKDDESVYIYED